MRLVLALGVIALTACQRPPPAPPVPLAIGGELPALSAPDLSGTDRALTSFGAGPLAIVFWSARCGCAAQCEPELARLASLGARVVLVASNEGEPAALVRDTVRERALPYPVLLDATGLLARSLGAVATPTLLLFDATNHLRYRGDVERAPPIPDAQVEGDLAFRDVKEGEVPAPPPEPRHFAREALAALVSGRTPDPAETPARGCALTLATFPAKSASW